MDAIRDNRLSDELTERLMLLWERTGDDGLQRIAVGEPFHDAAARAAAVGEEVPDEVPPDEVRADKVPPDKVVQERHDWVSTALMNCYKNTGDAQVFALIYELNETAFLQAIQYQLRRSVSSVDASDVLQEVFLNIYRYPHRFVAEKAESFRNWGHRIVRNTLLKFLKNDTRRARFTTLDEELGERPDTSSRTPYRSAADAEIAIVADRAFLLYLSLYLIHFEKLSAKERRALTMVEVEGTSYKAAAEELGIRLENLKMVIFRGRRKIWRGMNQSLVYLDSLSPSKPDRAARKPRSARDRLTDRDASLGSIPA